MRLSLFLTVLGRGIVVVSDSTKTHHIAIVLILVMIVL